MVSTRLIKAANELINNHNGYFHSCFRLDEILSDSGGFFNVFAWLIRTAVTNHSNFHLNSFQGTIRWHVTSPESCPVLRDINKGRAPRWCIIPRSTQKHNSVAHLNYDQPFT